MVQSAYYLLKSSNMQQRLAVLLLRCASIPAGLAVSCHSHALSRTFRAPGVYDVPGRDCGKPARIALHLQLLMSPQLPQHLLVPCYSSLNVGLHVFYGVAW